MQLWNAFLGKLFLLPTWLIFSYYLFCILFILFSYYFILYTYLKLVILIFFKTFSCPVNYYTFGWPKVFKTVYWKLFHLHSFKNGFKPFEFLFVFSLYSCKLPWKLVLISLFHWRLLNLTNTDIRSTFATSWFIKKWSTQIRTDV